MSSKLKVNNIIPSTGTQIGISTTGGGINLLTGTVVTGVVTATSFSGTASGNPTLTNGADNRVITASSASAIQGESGLTYNGSILNLTGDLAVSTANRIYFGNSDVAWVKGEHGGSGYLELGVNTGHVRILRNGRVGIGSVIPSDRLTVEHSNTGNPTGITIKNTNTNNHSHARLKLISQNGAKYTDIWTDVPNDSCRIGYNGSNSLMINNGNAYAKTTVSSWHNDYRVFQAGQASMVGKNPQDGSPAYFSNNAYYDASDSRWEFISSDDASQIEMENGSIKFKNGGTGSANGAITWVTNAWFNQSGNLRFRNGRGVDFGETSDASGMSNELLDDYEEGQWTPTVNVGTVGVADQGKYTKVGNVVNLQVLLYNFSNTSSSSSIIVTGVPYSCSGQAVGNVWLRRTNTNHKNYSCVIGDNATNSIVIVADSDGNNMGNNLQYNNFAHSTPYMNITITYRTS